MASPKFSLIVHGGAWDIPDVAVADCRLGIRHALEAGREALEKGGSALDGVEAAIVVLEDDVTFDAGTGSHLNRDGRAQLDAVLMDGATLQAGSVAAVERIRNPVRLARKILESGGPMLLAASGAELFAKENGLPLCSPEELVIERERNAWRKCVAEGHQAQFHFRPGQGTVGAVARDAQGRIAASTSTGGTCCKFPGRVGDSPLIGCGCYADDEAGGVSCTGHGEAIMRIVMAKTAVDLLRGPLAFYPGVERRRGILPHVAAKECIRLLDSRARGKGGLILLDRLGSPAAAFNTSRMAYGYLQPDGSYFVAP